MGGRISAIGVSGMVMFKVVCTADDGIDDFL